MEGKELYIHIPFCIKKCNYCDFLSFPSKEEEREAYTNALCQELKESAPLIKGDGLRSIFIGGGTPSILTLQQMGRIMDMVEKEYSFLPHIEISMEANPGTLNGEKLKGYRSMGINRLSMGLQSCDDLCLKRLGRIHTFDEFLKNFHEARNASFENINIDLMSALPCQTVESYEHTLETVAGLQPEHISSYSLILEEGTPFYEDEELVDLLPDEDGERKMYQMTQDILQGYGYHRYEISNYAKDGKECIHNLGYWDEVPYLGVGLGASSYLNGARFSNERCLDRYLRSPYKELSQREDYHILSRQEKMEEYMFLGLRKRQGVSMERFYLNFGRSMRDVFGNVMDRYLSLSLLNIEGDRLFLTDAGIDVSNRIFMEFLMN